MTSETRRPGSDPQFDARAVSAAPNDSVSPGGAMTRWLVVVLAVVIVAGGLLGYSRRARRLACRRRSQRSIRPQAHDAAGGCAVHFRRRRSVVGARRGDP